MADMSDVLQKKAEYDNAIKKLQFAQDKGGFSECRIEIPTPESNSVGSERIVQRGDYNINIYLRDFVNENYDAFINAVISMRDKSIALMKAEIDAKYTEVFGASQKDTGQKGKQ